MTFIRFPGESMTCDLPLDDLQKLVSEALRGKLLLELDAPDGRRIVINPMQIVYLRRDDDVPE
jgi:hypothetical protein